MSSRSISQESNAAQDPGVSDSCLPQTVVLFPVVLVTHGQPRSENIKWENPRNSQVFSFKVCVSLRSMMTPRCRLPDARWAIPCTLPACQCLSSHPDEQIDCRRIAVLVFKSPT